MAAFYRNLHTFFAPLHKPLSNSTDPAKIAARILAASSNPATAAAVSSAETESQPIYDLVFDPGNLTLHTSIPNIPEPGTLSAEGLASAAIPGWTRVEAINVHSQILMTVAETRSTSTADQLERTAKTSRGWWVVWMRVFAGRISTTSRAHDQTEEDLHLDSLQESPATTQESGRHDTSTEPIESHSSSHNTSGKRSGVAQTKENAEADPQTNATPEWSTRSSSPTTREAILIRRARDAAASALKSGPKSTSGMWATIGLGTSSASTRAGGQQAGWGPARLAEGIGVDARRYVEGLLSLNR